MPQLMNKGLWQCLLVACLCLAAPAQAAHFFMQHTPGGSSHLMALLQVADELTKRGHEVSIGLEDWEVEGFKGKGSLNNPRYKLLINSAYATPAEGKAEFIKIRDKFATLGANPIAALKYVLGVQADLCKKFVLNEETAAKLAALKPDMVIADFSHPCSVILADMKKVPYVIFSPTSLGEPLFSAMVGVDIPPSTFPMHGTGMKLRMSFLERFINFFAYHFMARFIAPGMLHNPLRQELNVTTRHSLGDARLFLMNADFAVEFPLSLPPIFKMVGPLLAAPSNPLPADLQTLVEKKSSGVIFVSFGSAFVLDKEEEVRTLAAALTTLANQGYTVLWRITNDELPPGVTLEGMNLPSNVHPLSWVPQNDLLGSPFLSAFIAHGGTNGVYEAPYHDLPLISIPFANDHQDHAAKAEYRGYGLTVPRATLTEGDPGPLVAAVEKLIGDESYKRSAEKVGRMLRQRAAKRTPAQRAADWVEFALEMPEDGSGDMKGIAGELSWAALHSIDVWAAWIAFLMAVVFGLVWGIIKVVKLLVALVRLMLRLTGGKPKQH